METYDDKTAVNKNMDNFLYKENSTLISDNLSRNSEVQKSFENLSRFNFQKQNFNVEENDAYLSNQKLWGGFGSGRRGTFTKHPTSMNSSNFINQKLQRKNSFGDEDHRRINNKVFDDKKQNFSHFDDQNCDKNYVIQKSNSFNYQLKNNYNSKNLDGFNSQNYKNSFDNLNERNSFNSSYNQDRKFKRGGRINNFNNENNYQRNNFQQENKFNQSFNNLNLNDNHYNNKNFQFNVNKDFQNTKPLPNNYVPVVRKLDEIYKEDIDQAENYRQIVDDDDEVAISGLNISNQVVIDTWEDAGFHPILLKNIIERSKYVRPRKIQAHVIPIVLQGRDIKGHAETGSGKTAAFMLPIIHMLIKSVEHKPLEKPSPYAIIIDPTRELCSQVYEQGLKLANETGVSVAKAYGQYNMRENLCELRAGCDVLCATPGRLKHFVQSNLISLSKLKYFVLDEADTLLESNFSNEIRELITSPNFPDKEHRQTMLFSATFPEFVQKLALDVLKENCVMVSNQKLVATNNKISQRFLQVHQNNKKTALLEILEDEMNNAKKNNPNNPNFCRTLVFVKTKRDADLVSLFLTEKQIKATTINGDRSQNLREKALHDFRTNQVSLLVSTDVCARGIDIKDLDHVINMDLPSEAVTYVHRIGRTGRIKRGRATSFFDETNSNDINIAPQLIEFLNDVQQPVPDFLIKAAEERGYNTICKSNQNYQNDDEMFNW